MSFSPRCGLLQDESLWLESEEADVLSVELDFTDWKDCDAALARFSRGSALTPTDAELLHSANKSHCKKESLSQQVSERTNSEGQI